MVYTSHKHGWGSPQEPLSIAALLMAAYPEGGGVQWHTCDET